MATSKVENSAQVLSCWLKFDHALAKGLLKCLWQALKDSKKSIVVQNKSNLLLMIFWNSRENYNYLQITQIRNFDKGY